MPIVFLRSFPKNFRYLLSLSAAVLIVLFAHDARAQAVYGSISGIVTDASGAIVPGATVTITSVERQTSDTVVSSDSGYYLKDRLLPGLYQVKAELQGFKTAVFDSIKVSVDTQTSLNVKLETGALSESVRVEGSTPVLKTDRADVASTFEARQITDMPILDRNFTKLVLLTPGTQQLMWQHAASENPQGSTQTMVNGQHFSLMSYQLDGTDNRDPVLGIIVINPNFEAISETKITSQNYDAEFGQAIAGVASVQTKSGTNALRGSGFEFFQNDAFQSRNPFTQALPDPLTGKFIPDTNKNQYGGSVGGPIQKDRFFFFGDYQGTRSKVGGSGLLSVPTQAVHNGDLSAYGVNIFDPQSGATPDTRSQFANNVIPQGRLSPQAQNVLKLIPLPNRPGTVNGTRDNFVASGSEVFDNDTFDTRVDGRINSRLNMFARYSFANFTRDGPPSFGAGGGQELVSLGGTSKVRNQSLATGFDQTIGSNMMADVRVGYFKYKVSVLPSDFGTTPAADAGIPGLNLDPGFTSGLFSGFVQGNAPDFNFGSGLGVNRCNCPLDEDEKQLQVVGNLTRLMSTHTVKFGVDVRHAWNLRVPSDRHQSGELTFNADRTRGPSGGGLGMATFLLGDVTHFARYTSPFTDAGERQWRSFYYAQDTWRASQRLTVNYGLRLDVINPQTVSGDGKGGFILASVTDGHVDIPSPNMLVGGVGGVPLNGGIENTLNWAPRLGAAYQLNERTVIRGGYGRSYDIGVFGSLFGHTVTQNLPVLSSQDIAGPNNFDSVFNLAQGPPAATFPTPGSNGQFVLGPGIQARVLPNKQRLPAVDAYNITVQREIGPMMSLEVGYVGNHSPRIFAGDDPNDQPNEPTLVGFPNVPRDQRRPFFAAYGWNQDQLVYCNCATNRYDSLQTKFTRRFSGGWSAFAQYTLQRERQHGDSQFFIQPDLEYGPADWDRVHSFSIATTYELPWMKTNAFLGGWQFNQNTIIQSGLPFNVTYRDAGADRDVGPNRPDLIGDPSGPGTQDQWFNATPIGTAGSAFGRPAVATFGNLPRNDLTGPAYWRVDASMFKRIHFGNTQALELRVEAVNIFNHVNLGNPDSEVGVPGTPNTNAGRITSTAFFGADPQRNFQFAVKFTF